MIRSDRSDLSDLDRGRIDIATAHRHVDESVLTLTLGIRRITPCGRIDKHDRAGRPRRP
jgi:hypothetical protein